MSLSSRIAAAKGEPATTGATVDDCHDVHGPLAPHIHRVDLGAPAVPPIQSPYVIAALEGRLPAKEYGR